MTYFRNGIPSGPEAHQDWPWELMYEDLMWAMEILNDHSSSQQNRRMATTIFQAWMGEVSQIRVHHQENASNLPIDA